VENIEESRTGSLFRFDVLVSLVLLIVTMLYFKNATTEYLSGAEETSLAPIKFFMLAMVFISFLILLMNGARITRDNLFLWFAVSYAFVGIFSTFVCNLYPAGSLPFRFVKLSYWVWVLIISYYSVLHLNTLKFHLLIACIFLPILFYLFFILLETYRGASSQSSLVLNPVFYISFLIPTILLVRSKILKISGILLIFAAILISYKRSAIVAFVTSIPVYFYARTATSTSGKFKKLIPVIFGGTLLLLLLIFTFKYVSNTVGLEWGQRLESATATGGSGRLDRYIGYIGLLSARSIPQWIIGNGHLATEFTQYSWAHNDILEVLYDFGILGFIFYLLFISQLAKTFFDMKRYKYKHFDAFAVSLVIFFWGSMFSMLIVVPYWFLNLAFFWGWVIADFHNAKRYGDSARIGNPLYTCADYEDNFEEHTDLSYQN
jgi:hypothetical protein